VRLDALLFDLDGTLVDTDPVHYRAWREALAEHGVAIDEASYARRVSGRHNPDIVADLLPSLDAAAREALIERKEARFRELAPRLTPLAGAAELLRRARAAGVATAVVSNAPRPNALFMLRAIDLEEAVDALVLSDEVAAAKPDPAPYAEALRRLDCPPRGAVAFEDSPSGVRSARAAGVRVVGVATTQRPDALRAEGARQVIRDFADPGLREGPLAELLAAEAG
jgi:HAD superfamily hydrolase (TIGR01509 family)